MFFILESIIALTGVGFLYSSVSNCLSDHQDFFFRHMANNDNANNGYNTVNILLSKVHFNICYNDNLTIDYIEREKEEVSLLVNRTIKHKQTIEDAHLTVAFRSFNLGSYLLLSPARRHFNQFTNYCKEKTHNQGIFEEDLNNMLILGDNGVKGMKSLGNELRIWWFGEEHVNWVDRYLEEYLE